MQLLLRALFDVVDRVHRLQRVLVHGVVVIHVELRLADDAAEFRHEAAEHAGLVHQRQHDARMVLAGDDVEEHRA
jgi:hypothetical protein